MADKIELAFAIDGETYEVKNLTLDDGLLIDRVFGIKDITEYEWTRTAYLAALVYLGMRDKHPFLTHEQLMRKVGEVDLNDLGESIVAAIEAAGQDPTQTGDEPEAVPEPKPKPAKKRSAKVD